MKRVHNQWFLTQSPLTLAASVDMHIQGNWYSFTSSKLLLRALKFGNTLKLSFTNYSAVDLSRIEGDRIFQYKPMPRNHNAGQILDIKKADKPSGRSQ
jgi:hypothetical protein